MPKVALRSHYLALRSVAHAAFGPSQQADLERNLFSIPAFSSARTLLLYASMRDEVPTRALIERLLRLGRRVALPITRKAEKTLTLSRLSSLEDLRPALFGVPEPAAEKRQACPSSSVDVALIPGLAFDMQGSRLGHGLGYYDRFLPSLSCPKIGLAYDVQISASALPREAHDYAVDYVVSEKRVVVCAHPRG